MKVKISKNGVDTPKGEFKVLGINYDFVMVEAKDGRRVFRTNEVKIIPEDNSESIFAYYKDLLKIKFDNGMTMNFYAEFINFLEDIVGKKIENIGVLEDKYGFIKKGIWEKKLFVTINKSRAFKINVIGQKYSDDFRFTIKEVSLSDFMDQCSLEISNLKSDIKEKRILMNMYNKAMKDMLYSGLNNNKTIFLKN